MKNKLTLAIVAVVVAFSSCSKDYTCTCTYNTGGNIQTTVTPIQNVTKKEGKTECERDQSIYHEEKGGSVTFYTTVTCKLN